MNRFKVYIVDDEESIRQGVALALKKQYDIRAFARAESAIAALRKDPPDLVLLDIGLPGMSGLEALGEIKALSADVLVIMVTGYEDVSSVINAMKAGAYDYIVKPLQADSLRVTVANALETVRMRKEIQLLQERYIRENLPCFMGESDAVQDMMDLVTRVAKSPDTPVLITGESGTGKELIAHAIHYRSPRYRGPFVALNCASLPKELVESELFGYEKGAFSGAAESGKAGLVEKAAGGTLFLDEVGALGMEAQAKLLRFIEQGEYYKVGGTRQLDAQCRVISATNQDLTRMVDDQEFRLDLYYRLAVIRIEVPSLNERPEDILPLAKAFLIELSQKHAKQFTGIAPGARELLEQHHWRGNVRELRNVIERGVLLGTGPLLQASHLGIERAPAKDYVQVDAVGAFPPLPAGGIDLARLEEHYLRQALSRAEGNTVEAARLLGLSYYAFRYRLRKMKS